MATLHVVHPRVIIGSMTSLKPAPFASPPWSTPDFTQVDHGNGTPGFSGKGDGWRPTSDLGRVDEVAQRSAGRASNAVNRGRIAAVGFAPVCGSRGVRWRGAGAPAQRRARERPFPGYIALLVISALIEPVACQSGIPPNQPNVVTAVSFAFERCELMSPGEGWSMSVAADIVETGELGDRSYIAHDELAIMGDPQRDLNRVESVLAEIGLRCDAVLESHIHNDSTTGGRCFWCYWVGSASARCSTDCWRQCGQARAGHWLCAASRV